MNDLTGFQRDLLRGLTVLGESSGLDLLDYMEDEVGYRDVNHGRLYPNLDSLTTKGLIHKEDGRDRRTNAYSLTRRGEREVVEEAEAWNRAVEDLRETRPDGGGESGLDALFPDREQGEA